ncbi:MAG: hypothetical protein M0R68_01800 [Bacteroidetes bacterium]|nr:hypothetical protein [Bacteroidota bacterium]
MNQYNRISFPYLALIFIGFLITVFSGVALSQRSPEDVAKTNNAGQRVALRNSRSQYSPQFLSKVSAAIGNAKYLRYGKHNGNLIETGFINNTSISNNYLSGSSYSVWPKGSGTEYGYAFVFFVGAKVVNTNGDSVAVISESYRRHSGDFAPDASHTYQFQALPGYFNDRATNSLAWTYGGISEDVGVDGIPKSNDFGENDGILQTAEDVNGNGILDKELVNTPNWPAMSHLKHTWPKIWAPQTFPGDVRNETDSLAPSIRDGRWNGEFGAYIRADQESYYAADDRENDEFSYYAFEDSLSKRPFPNGRRGLGITVETRGYQWSSRLAEDILINIFDITNFGKKLHRSIVGMFVDPDMGGSLSGDNASFDNVDDITYAWSDGDVSNLGLPLGYFGFAFLESPGISNDGKDNDGDGIIDESQGNAADEDADWEKFTDTNLDGVWTSEDTNKNGVLDEGEDINTNGRLDYEAINDDIGSDGIGPDQNDYIGPDANGTQGNGKPDQGEPNFGFTDNDESDQVGLTSFYLTDVSNAIYDDELFWNKEIVPGQYITVPGYDRDISWIYGSGEVSIDSGRLNAQRYAIALLFGNDKADILRNKKTMQVIYDHDYNFASAPRVPTVTSQVFDKKVILRWDAAAERSKDAIYGADFEAYYIYKSTSPTFDDIKTITDAYGNPLLFRPEAIFDVNNGLSGVHPVSIGSEINQASDLGISYNMGTDSGIRHYFVDSNVQNGRVYYYAVVSVDRGYDSDFFARGLTDRAGLAIISPTECSANILLDDLGRPVSADRNIAIVTPSGPASGYVFPSLSLNGITRNTDTTYGTIGVEIFEPYKVQAGHSYRLSFEDDSSYLPYSTKFTGLTKKIKLHNLTTNSQLMGLAYPNSEATNELIYEGFKLTIRNYDTVGISLAKWKDTVNNIIGTPKASGFGGFPVPRNYEIRITDTLTNVDTSLNNIATNYQIWDVTKPDSVFRVKFRLTESGTAALKGKLSNNDQVVIVSDLNRRLWYIDFTYPPTVPFSKYLSPRVGSVFQFSTTKPFDRNSYFEFTIDGNTTNSLKVKTELANIYTVPDPYVAASSLEQHLVSLDAGRGDRRIDFVNLPSECTISIFTSSGRLVRVINHSSTIENSREPWDLRTKDGLEVTHGIYLWVVEAPGIGKRIGKLAVIK